MKYLSIIVIVVVALATFFIGKSCLSDKSSSENNSQVESRNCTVVVSSPEEKITIFKYEFEGHLYQFHSVYRSWGGPVHDPNCPCHNKTNNQTSETDSISN